MPHPQGSRNHQQRRVFRGRGGPTDGNIPPQRTSRPKVKYHHQAEEGNNGSEWEGGRRRRVDNEEVEGENVHDENSLMNNTIRLQQLSIDAGASHDEGEQQQQQDDKLQLEIQHLHKRIQNVQLSLQTSQGLSNPKTWRTNCLFPVKNVVKEWRSIVLFHPRDDNGNVNTMNQNNVNVNLDGVEVENDGIVPNDEHSNGVNGQDEDQHYTLHSTAKEVFGLIQMTMQTGPLVGSNPGYFKRCGGEVASIALEFLKDVVELAGVAVDERVGEEKKEDNVVFAVAGGRDDGSCVERDDVRVIGLEDASSLGDCPMGEKIEHKPDDMCDECSNGESSDSESNTSSSDSCSSINSTPDERLTQAQIDSNLPTDIPSTHLVPPSITKHEQTLHNLQTTFLFSEKQSQRFCQWIRNAQKAAENNKLPSKSAKKLQDQKSKKQRQKELKVERKKKKKKRAGGKA